MNSRKYLLGGISVLLAVTLSGPSADGAVTANSNDLFLAFRASAGMGVEQTYLVEIGNYTLQNFPNTPGTRFTLSLGNIGNDLKAQFGDNWYNRADLNWGIFGSGDSASPITLFTSRERPSLSQQSEPWSPLGINSGTANDARLSIRQARDYINANGGSTTTANSNFGFFQNAEDPGTYAQAISPTLSPGAPDFRTWSRIEGDFGAGISGTALDLYRFYVVNDSDTSVAYRGTFTIDEAGVVTYMNLAIPEPSTMALVSVAGALLLNRRRRTSPVLS
jgi:hypothetical protein